ncbi:MAG: hypothetical protein MJZ95_04115 [Paludibacteraceae bacterium]|nr:hypothetical protein [Paludibacteraceae bacterium]
MRKRLSLFVLALMAFGFVFGQDKIVLTDNKTIIAKVATIGENYVSYYDWDNQNGPQYTLSKAKILYILYQNGKKEVFNTDAGSKSTPTVQQNKTASQTSAVKFQANVDVSGRLVLNNYVIRDYWSSSMRNIRWSNQVLYGGPAVDLELGISISNMFFVGAGAEFMPNFCNLSTSNHIGEGETNSVTSIVIPMYANFRFFKGGKTGNVGSYYELALGGYTSGWEKLQVKDGVNTYLPEEYRTKPGFFLRAGLGLQSGIFCFGAGYELLLNSAINDNFFFVKLGLALTSK